jgi:hypothetical protein
MQRILILMAVFAFVAAAAFADEAPPAAPPTAQFLSFYNEGQVFLYNKEGDGPATYGWGPTWDYAYGNGISSYNPNAAYDSGSIDQEWGFAYNSAVDKNGNSYGFSATIEFGGDNLLEDSSVNSFYTYYKFGDVARLLLGLPRYDLGTGTLIEGAGTERFYNGSLMGDGSTSAAQYAAAVDFFPAKGLTVTLAAFIPSVVSIANVFTSTNWMGGTYPFGAYTGGDGSIGGWQGIATAAAIDYLNDMGVAATYAVPNLGNFLVQYYRLKNLNYDGTNAAGATLVDDRFDFVANITKWQGYDIKFQYDANNVLPVANPGQTALSMTSEVWLSASADFGKISLAFDSGLLQNLTHSSVLSGAAEVQGEYKLGGAFSAGMRVGYQDANGIEFFDGGNGCWSGFEVWPYVKASFDNYSYIMLGLVYASGATPSASLGFSPQSAVIAVPIQFVWAFM